MKRWLASLFLLSGCGAVDEVGAPEEMSFSAARANLTRVAGSGSATAFCSAEGRLEFRRAVRTYTSAAVAENVQMTPLQLSQNDEAQGLVMVGLVARIVKPSDLYGPYRAWGAIMNMPGARMALGDADDAMAKACPELVTVYREIAAMMRLQARMQDTDDMSERDRQRLSARADSQAGRLQSAMERLAAKMRAEGWDGDGSMMLP